MIVPQSGKAYDLSNENNCDIILVTLYVNSLQMRPSFLERIERLLILEGEPCLPWNIGKASMDFVTKHVCGCDE